MKIKLIYFLLTLCLFSCKKFNKVVICYDLTVCSDPWPTKIGSDDEVISNSVRSFLENNKGIKIENIEIATVGV